MSVHDRSVFVAGFEKGLPQEDIVHWMDQVGEIDHVFMAPDPEVFALVVFKKDEDALRAIRDLNGREFKAESMTVKSLTEKQVQLLNKLLPMDPVFTQLANIFGKLSAEQRSQAMANLQSFGEVPQLKPISLVDQAKVVENGKAPVTRSEGAGPVLPRQVSVSTPARAVPFYPQFSPQSPGPMFPSIPIPFQPPRLPTFSGDSDSKGDVSYQRWRYEVRCLVNAGHTQELILQAIRRSLKGTPADVLTWLGEGATVNQIVEKMDGLYGNVLTGEALVQKFYSARQKPDEPVAKWGCRLEGIISQAVTRGKVDKGAMNSMLRTKFWADLHDENLKAATRYKFDTIDSFLSLVSEVRAVEQEMEEDKQKRKQSSKPASKGQVASATVAVENDALPTDSEKLMKMIKDLSTQLDKLERKVEKQMSQPGNNKAQTAQVTKGEEPGKNKDSDEVICYRCKQVGHLSYGCRVKLPSEQKNNPKKPPLNH